MAFNHKGRIERMNVPNWSRSVNLRKTKKFWIAEDGTKFYADSGKQYANKKHADVLDVTTITPKV